MRNVKIHVDFYDSKEKDAIENNYPEDYQKICSVVGKTINVPFEDFKTFGFFRHQFTENGRPASFQDLKPHAQEWGNLNFYLKLQQSGALINVYPNKTIEAEEIPETVGVAGALSVASHIYGLTQADWVKIPIKSHKDFDFSHSAALKNQIVLIEAKGSIVDDNTYKRPTISQHKANIRKKKTDPSFISQNKDTKSSFIGYITVADGTNNLQTWLVDPITEELGMDPYKLKLLKRLTFYYQVIKAVSGRSNLALTLANRLQNIIDIPNFRELDRRPLINSEQDALIISDQLQNTHRIGAAMNQFFGTFRLHDYLPTLLFLPNDLLNLMIKQDFDAILDFSFPPRTTETRMRVPVSKRVAEQVSRLQKTRLKVVTDFRKQSFLETDIFATISSSGLGFWTEEQTDKI
jgi:hypothetical protein